MKDLQLLTVLLVIITLNYAGHCQSPIMKWSFNEKDKIEIENSASGILTFKDGTVGKALLFDGYSTEITRHSNFPAKSTKAFSITAWIAPQEYSWNISAIINQQSGFERGYLFGINHEGKLVASIALNNQWVSVVSEQKLPLLKWSFVAVIFDHENGISLFINDEEDKRKKISGTFSFEIDTDICIGKTQTKMTPANTERKTSKAIQSWMRFDGLIDEVQLFDTALKKDEIVELYNTIQIVNNQPLEYRKMPSGTDKSMPFGAYYSRLKYSPGWDALWVGSDYPDVVVRFSNSPVKLVFWRGTGYIPAMVSENGIWMTDQSMENFVHGECYEAMGDKQCRYSHVRIIENSPARCVIHWRHALAGIKHQILHEKINTPGDWADEYWTVYPDGVVVRKQVLWTRFWEEEKKGYQFQETIFFNQPGTKPQDNVEYSAITFSDLEGNKAEYSWKKGAPKDFNKTKYHSVQLVNFKSKYKPFGIYTPDRIVFPFRFGWVEGYSTFPCWNHWPVSQIASDGRNAVAPDKPSHSSLTQVNGDYQIIEKGPDNSILVRSLVGMTEQPIDSLLSLARSWNYPPNVHLISSGYFYTGYDKYERTYKFERNSGKTQKIEFEVEANEKSPICNLSIIIRNWNTPTVLVEINGQKSKDFVTSLKPTLEGNELIVWINLKSEKVTKICIRESEKND